MLLLQHFTKKCYQCDTIKKIYEFNKCSSKKDGVQTKCRNCSKKYRDKNRYIAIEYSREYNLKNKEILATKKLIYLKNNREVIKLRRMKTYQDNRESVLEYYRGRTEIDKPRKTKYNARYYIKNKETMAEYKKQYVKTDNGRAVIANARYKRRTRKQNGHIDTVMLRNLYKNAKVCYWCNANLKNVKTHLDHYVPLAKGGEHTLSNLVISCAKCNQTKNAKDPIVFANSIGKLL